MDSLSLLAIRDSALKAREDAESILWKKAWLDLAAAADHLNALIARLRDSDSAHIVEVVDEPRNIALEQQLGIADARKGIPMDEPEDDNNCDLCGTEVKAPAELFSCSTCGLKTCQLCFGCSRSVRSTCKVLREK